MAPRRRDQRARGGDRRAQRRRAARPDGEFKEQVDKGAELDDLLPEAFAVVREAAKRALGMRHFDVQLIGGMVLHHGKIAEMKTGEGKTLVATLPVYLNALAGKGVHVVTVNDYLARRDAEWMGAALQLPRPRGRRDRARPRPTPSGSDAYAADITYGQNNEFGFDYLRDNMKFAPGGLRPARAQLRHRRRGRLDPDRRGAHAAHHLRARPRSRPTSTTSSTAIIPRADQKRRRATSRVDEKTRTRDPHRGGRRQGREAARRRQPLRPERHRDRCTTWSRRCARTPSTSATSTTW